MPVLKTRSIADFPVGNIPLRDHHAAMDKKWTIHPEAWISPADLELLEASEAATLVDEHGNHLAWLGLTPNIEVLTPARESFLIRHSWDLIRANELFVGSLLPQADLPADAVVHPLAVIEGVVRIGRGTRILPGVYIEGNAVIGANCKIGPNCYIRGNTSIGDHCHIGNAVEIKNSILLAGTNVGHLSYVGDSILGEKVNFGAGTVTSNLRHDGRNHRTLVDGTLIDTGRRKFGTIVGDGVHTGINTSIYPGRKLGPGSSTLPGQVVQSDIS